MLLTIEDTISYICDKYEKAYTNENNEVDLLKKFIEKNFNLANSINDNTINELEAFCASKSNLIKVNKCQIPPGILEGTLSDIKVNPSRNNPDDSIYAANKDIQKNIPRGMTILNNDHRDICIYANKKFSDNGDEYFLDGDEKNKIVSVEKINGEALHFSCRYILDKFYLFIGSKAKHIVIHKESDIDLYTDETVRKFAKMVYKTLAKLPLESIQVLFSLLHHTKITAVCEFLQYEYQHIVNFGNTDKLVFLTFTSTYGNDKSLTAFPPHITLNMINLLQLPFAPYTVFNYDREEENKYIIKNEKNSEGKVFYYLNRRNETIGMTKIKTNWYICLRALREKAKYYLNMKKKKKEQSPEITVINSINKRYNEIQTWQTLTDNVINYWKNIGKFFILWLQQQNDNLELQAQFPKIWEKFLIDTKN